MVKCITRRFCILFLTLASMTSFGQSSGEKKVVDSLESELIKVNVMLEHHRNEAERLKYLLAAKEMALRSMEIEDSTFHVLAAIQAHNFWKNNEGAYGDIDIYRGLHNALQVFEDPLLNTLPIRIDSRENIHYGKTNLMADRLCSLVRRNMLLKEWNAFASRLPYERTCPSAK